MTAVCRVRISMGRSLRPRASSGDESFVKSSAESKVGIAPTKRSGRCDATGWHAELAILAVAITAVVNIFRCVLDNATVTRLSGLLFQKLGRTCPRTWSRPAMRSSGSDMQSTGPVRTPSRRYLDLVGPLPFVGLIHPLKSSETTLAALVLGHLAPRPPGVCVADAEPTPCERTLSVDQMPAIDTRPTGACAIGWRRRHRLAG